MNTTTETRTLMPTPVAVCGEILPGKIDPSSVARFANFDRAEQYALVLFDSKNYAAVIIREDSGKTYEMIVDDDDA